MINANQTILKKLDIANLPIGGSLGSASTTVDIGSAFFCNQTTTGRSISIPTPTITTDPRIITIWNSGTASFMVGTTGRVIEPTKAAQYSWTGSAWVEVGADLTIQTTSSDLALDHSSGVRRIFVNASGANRAITLPIAANMIGQIEISKEDSTANTITVSVSGGGTINGQTTQVLQFQYSCLTVVSNGTEYRIN